MIAGDKTGITRQAQRGEMRLKRERERQRERQRERERERERTLMLLKHTAIANTNHNPISSQISMNPYTLLILVPRVLCPTFNKELQAMA